MHTTESSLKPRVLIVDSDPIIAQSLSDVLEGHEYETATALTAQEALDMLHDAEQAQPDRVPHPFHVVIADVNLSSTRNTDLLPKINELHPDLIVIIVTAYGTIESAVQAMKNGAFDYLTHPIVEDELVSVVGKAARQGILQAQNQFLRNQLDDQRGLDNIIGRDTRMIRLYDLIRSVAPTKTTVLMTGESGTGKSLVARAIHQHSSVCDGPYIELSCGSIPETLLESELFGHVKGAFTGAHADKAGRFLAADKGTIFLDEINSASAGMQLKLLRVLQERRFEPVGSTETVEVDVRVVLATNQPLEPMVADGQFRQDLYYRINVVTILLPPLRDRIGDIPLLTEHFLSKYNKEMDKHFAGLTDEAAEALQRYSYPGNVRELENIIQRAVVLGRKGVIGLNDLPDEIAQPNEGSHDGRIDRFQTTGSHTANSWSGEPLGDALEYHEQQIILAALNANNWNRQQTSDQLGINRTTLYKKIKQYGLDSIHRAG